MSLKSSRETIQTETEAEKKTKNINRAQMTAGKI